MKKKDIKKLFHGEMSYYKEKMVVRFMSEQATAQAYSYLGDHIKELKLKGDDAEKLPWVNRQADKLFSQALDNFYRHSNIAYGLKIALEDICDELTLEVYQDYAMLIVDSDNFEVDPYTCVAEYGVSVLDNPLKDFAKLRKKYLEFSEKVSKAKANMGDAKDGTVTDEATSPDSKRATPDKETMEWMSFEELVQNTNAEDSSEVAPMKEALTEESPAEEESHE